MKRERLEQMREMARDGRDIVAENAQDCWARTKSFYRNSLRAYVIQNLGIREIIIYNNRMRREKRMRRV